MSEKRTDEAGTRRQAEAPVSKGERAAKESPTVEHADEANAESDRRPDDEEIDTAAEQRPPSDS